MERFRHGRVLFAGDAAHGVSPFGARGANSGVQDADNLTWKLKLVLSGTAPAALLDTYGAEREEAADENLLRSSQSTDFITPKNAISKAFRDATLLLSKRCPFARQLINSGRLSAPAIYRDSPLNTPDADAFAGQMIPGAPCADAPIAVAGRQAWFLEHTTRGFTAVYFCGDSGIDDATIRVLRNLMSQRIPVFPVIVAPKYFRDDGSTDMTIIEDTEGLLAKRYDASAGTLYLTRPDQHICARWRNADLTTILAAVRRATCNQES
jgi:3-(3-hydroxy-phenyl)propionate hydroxylase